MKVQSVLLKICAIIAAGCLSAGYILAGYWLILPVLLIVALIWILTKKRSQFWRASGALLAFILLSAFGIVANLSLELMIVACSAALVSWDLIQFTQGLGKTPLHTPNPLLAKVHLNSLALAASLGLAAAFMSAYINLHFSFGVIVVLVLIAIGLLTYSVQYFMKKK